MKAKDIKSSIEETRAALRNIASGNNTESKATNEKTSKEDVVTKNKEAPEKEKKESAKKNVQSKKESVLPDSVKNIYNERGQGLVERIKEYSLDDEPMRRITYVISEKNYNLLSSLKSETNVPITSLINILLNEAIVANSEEVEKIIRKQFKNLRL